MDYSTGRMRRLPTGELIALSACTFAALLLLLGLAIPIVWALAIGMSNAVPFWPLLVPGRAGVGLYLLEIVGRLILTLGVALAWWRRWMGAAVLLINVAVLLGVGTLRHPFPDSYTGTPAWPPVLHWVEAIVEMWILSLLSTAMAFWFILADSTPGRQRRVVLASVACVLAIVATGAYYLFPPTYLVVRKDGWVQYDRARFDVAARLLQFNGEIDFARQTPTRRQLEAVAAMPSLLVLTLDGCDIGTEDLSPLRKSTSIRRVHVRSATLSDAAVATLDSLWPNVIVVTDGWKVSAEAQLKWDERHR